MLSAAEVDYDDEEEAVVCTPARNQDTLKRKQHHIVRPEVEKDTSKQAALCEEWQMSLEASCLCPLPRSFWYYPRMFGKK